MGEQQSDLLARSLRIEAKIATRRAELLEAQRKVRRVQRALGLEVTPLPTASPPPPPKVIPPQRQAPEPLIDDPSLGGMLPFLPRQPMPVPELLVALDAELAKSPKEQELALIHWLIRDITGRNAADLRATLLQRMDRRTERLDLDGEGVELSWIPASETQPPFWIGTTEVSQRLWKQVMGHNPSHFLGLHLPVDSVSWCDSVRFCNALSEQLQLQPAYIGVDACESSTGQSVRWIQGRDGFRLPTAKEWRRASATPPDQDFWAGDGSRALDLVGWNVNNSDDRTHRPAQKPSNPRGLYDLHGNVAEWIWDEEQLGSAIELPVDGGALPGLPKLESGSSREFHLRGGSWDRGARFSKSSSRFYQAPMTRDLEQGLRLARSPAPNTEETP